MHCKQCLFLKIVANSLSALGLHATEDGGDITCAMCKVCHLI